MFYARYRLVRTLAKDDVDEDNKLKNGAYEKIVDERWIAIDAGKKTIAQERAQELRPPHDRFVAEDGVLRIDVYDERDMLDLRLDRAYLVEKIEDREPNPREAAMAETLNLIREALHDVENRLQIRDESGDVVEVIRVDRLFAALDSGPTGGAYLTTGEGDFERERDEIVKSLLGIALPKSAGETTKTASRRNDRKGVRHAD
jgi:hypothetical protein